MNAPSCCIPTTYMSVIQDIYVTEYFDNTDLENDLYYKEENSFLQLV